MLHAINSIIHRSAENVNYSFIDSCLLKNIQVDIRLGIDWDANETGIDLCIADPRKEKCS